MKNFGEIKNIFNTLLAESLVKKNKNKQKLFHSYLKLIKENEILKTQFLVYDNIENKIEENENKIYQYIQENIKLLKKFKKKDILEANEKLANLLNEDKYPQVTPFISPRKVNVGDKIQVMMNSGVQSGDIGVVVNSREVKTDGRGVPTEIMGSYKPIDWGKQIVYRNLNGQLESMFKSRVTIIPNDVWEKIINDKENIWKNFKKQEVNENTDLKTNKLIELFLAVKNSEANKYESIGKELDMIKVPYTLQNAISKKAKDYRYKKEMDTMEAKSIVNNIEQLMSNPLHENITKLIFTDKTSKNIDVIIESQSQIVDYIKNNKKKEIIIKENKESIPNSILSKLMIDRFNEKYNEQLTESEKELFKILLNGTENTKKDLQNKTITECLDLVNNKLKHDDITIEIKDKLLKTKDKLLTLKESFIIEDFNNNITKLNDLRGDLLK